MGEDNENANLGCEIDDDVIIDIQGDVNEDKYDGDGESLDDDYIPSHEEGLNLKIKMRMNVLTTLIIIMTLYQRINQIMTFILRMNGD